MTWNEPRLAIARRGAGVFGGLVGDGDGRARNNRALGIDDGARNDAGGGLRDADRGKANAVTRTTGITAARRMPHRKPDIEPSLAENDPHGTAPRAASVVLEQSEDRILSATVR